MQRTLGAAAAACALAAGPLVSGASAEVSPRQESPAPGLYVVVLRQPPLATYEGNRHGYAATAPRDGQRFDARRPAVTTYRSLLESQQQRVLDLVGQPTPLYSYTTTLNGFAAELTSQQLKRLRSLHRVASVQPSRTTRVDGRRQHDDLGLHRPGSAWAALGGPEAAGKGVVIGVVDTGVWPENPSFAGLPSDAKELRHTYPGFTGRCEPGERWSADTCNSKVVAARYFVQGFGVDNVASAEFLSPRDGSGHGSHTASTAAGNAGVAVKVDGQRFGHITGVAPAAGLAVYKACWTAPDPDDDGCTTADALMAIDQAVSDGVDVLNYSIADDDTGGSIDTGDSDSVGAGAVDAVDLAFLNAATAGVVVAASAGDTDAVQHAVPWVTTVGATSHDGYQGSVTLGDGTTYVGSMVSSRDVSAAPLVYGGDAPAAGATARQAATCAPGSLDGTAVDGAVVACDRGDVARVVKGGEVDRAGGVAMLLLNDARGPTEADIHVVPTVQLRHRDGRSVMRYLATAARPAASIDADGGTRVPAPEVAEFSARAPAVDADILKPDVVAPGFGVLAAVAPPSDLGRLWDLYSGTSMAAPHVAGLAALVVAAHPDWSPAVVRSALMTTARPVAEPAGPLDRGAGEASPGTVLDPGLAYDSDRDGWRRFLRGRESELNEASIAVGDLVGSQTVRRVATNVGNRSESYVADVTGLRGIAVSVSPGTLTLQPGESKAFRVSVTARRSARYGTFAAGELTWTGSRGHVVTSPVVIRPESVAAPAEAAGDDRTGLVRIRAVAGVTGTVRARPVRLVPARAVDVVLEPGRFDVADPTTDASTSVHAVEVPARTAVLRIELAAARADDDLDLFVYREDRIVASATSAGDERVTIDRPRPGRYEVYVHSAASGSDGTTVATLTSWVLPGPSTGSGRGTVAAQPRRVTVTGGEPFDLEVRWPTLRAGKRWFGVVDYKDSDAQTFVTLD